MINLFRNKAKYEAWDDIKTMPFHLWRKIHETGDIKYLIKKGNPNVEQLKLSWHNIHNQYLSKYGLDNKTKRMLEKRKRLAVYINKYLATGDRVYEMEVDILTKEIEKDNEGKGKGQDYSEITASIEKYFGFQVNENKTSVDKYYSYLALMKRDSDRLKRLKANG